MVSWSVMVWRSVQEKRFLQYGWKHHDTPCHHDTKKTMIATLFHFVIELPGTGMGLCWIGGGLKRSERPGFVWLTPPSGEPVLEAPRSQVHPSSRDDLAKRLLAERQLARAPVN